MQTRINHRKQDAARPVTDWPLLSDSTALLIIAVAAALISDPMLGWFVVAALSLGMIALILRSWHKRHPDT